MKLIFASHNENKTAEIRQLLPAGIELLSLNDLNFQEEILETSDTLEGNSALKAAYIYSIFKLPCFADDSGLEVDFLQNRPGVYSARYAGEPKNDDNNMNKLLDDLKGIKHRKAQFRTVITLMLESATHSFEGIITGEITEQKIGKNGFGYDPIFRPIDEVKTFAQMTMKEKNARSHRALALEKMISFLSLGKFSN
ncbi:MAG: RdgB/HAM1 family non-canonical purine NTP pyrophosphatase [Crocinitomicaceae bacterium]|nr:RdgB/HAM1 family non-canonical purine NTP pyrophosphatase [Crocinitomicaceae bacterium]